MHVGTGWLELASLAVCYEDDVFPCFFRAPNGRLHLIFFFLNSIFCFVLIISYKDAHCCQRALQKNGHIIGGSMIGVVPYAQFLEAHKDRLKGSASSVTSMPLRTSQKEAQLKHYKAVRPLLQQPIRYDLLLLLFLYLLFCFNLFLTVIAVFLFSYLISSLCCSVIWLFSFAHC
jgi:hypothetical protein